MTEGSARNDGMPRCRQGWLVVVPKLNKNRLLSVNLLLFYISKGQWVEALQLKLNGCELRLNEQGENQRKMKKEIEEQAQIQQNLHENLMAGVIVNFMIMVVICMLPRALLASA